MHVLPSCLRQQVLLLEVHPMRWISIFAILVATSSPSLVRAQGPTAVGTRAPGFTATTMESPARVKTLDDYRGRVVLLAVWATWCAECRDEFVTLQRIHSELVPQGLSVVAVSVDAASDQGVRKYASELGVTFDVLHDQNHAIKQAHGARGGPVTFVIGRAGTIPARAFRGQRRWDAEPWRSLLIKLLAEPRS